MTLLFRKYKNCLFRVYHPCRRFWVKDIQTGKTTDTRQLLDQVMDSLALVANANHKLNMKRRELIKPDLAQPYFLWTFFTGDQAISGPLKELRHSSRSLKS